MGGGVLKWYGRRRWIEFHIHDAELFRWRPTLCYANPRNWIVSWGWWMWQMIGGYIVPAETWVRFISGASGRPLERYRP